MYFWIDTLLRPRRHYFHMSRNDQPIFEFMLDNLGYYNTASWSNQNEYNKTKLQIAHLGDPFQSCLSHNHRSVAFWIISL